MMLSTIARIAIPRKITVLIAQIPHPIGFREIAALPSLRHALILQTVPPM
jgi:hypothetical protein